MECIDNNYYFCVLCVCHVIIWKDSVKYYFYTMYIYCTIFYHDILTCIDFVLIVHARMQESGWSSMRDLAAV